MVRVFLQFDFHLCGGFAVRNMNLLSAALCHLRLEASAKIREDVPILFRDEVQNLRLPVADDLQGRRLHSAGGKSPAHLFPEQRADLISHQTIQHSPGLLGIHQAHVDGSRMFQGFFYRLLVDFIKFNSAFRGWIDTEKMGDMPGYCLPFPVRVRCQKDALRTCGFLLQLPNGRALAPDVDVLRLEMVVHIHRQPALRKIPNMTHGRDDFITGSQIFSDNLRLGWRLHHQQSSGSGFGCFLCCLFGCFLLCSCCHSLSPQKYFTTVYSIPPRRLICKVYFSSVADDYAFNFKHGYYSTDFSNVFVHYMCNFIHMNSIIPLHDFQYRRLVTA